MQCYVLDNLFLLVYVSLWHRHILLGFKIKLCRIRIGPAYTLACARVCLDVDDIANSDALLLNGFVNRWVKSQLFGAFAGFETNEEV